MAKIPSPEEIRRTGQIISSEKLILWAEASGFETRRSKAGTSHVVCRHLKYPDIRFNIIINSSQRGSQRSLADCLTEIRRREDNTAKIHEDFSIACDNSKIKILKAKLPAYIEAFTNSETRQIVLRDKNIPQLGLTLQPGEVSIVENKVRFLEDLKREAFELIGRARTNFDIDTKFSHGVFDGKLSHLVYKNLPKMEVLPYQADEPTDKIFTALQEYIAKVEERDIEYQIRLEDALSNDAVNNIQVAFNTRRGVRNNVISIKNPKDGTALNLEFTTKSNQRAVPDKITGRISGAQLTHVESVLDKFAIA